MRTTAWEGLIFGFMALTDEFVHEKEAEEVTFRGEINNEMPISLTCSTTHAEKVSWGSDSLVYSLVPNAQVREVLQIVRRRRTLSNDQIVVNECQPDGF